MLTSLKQLAMRSLLITALIYVQHVNVISSNAVFTNVAYSKPVTLSSEHGLYPGTNAVNGLLSDFTHTATEKLPWLRIDLGAQHLVHEIEVFARSDCCGNQLHDFDVKVGENIHDMEFCGHFTGHAFTGQRIATFCPHNTMGRYVQLQIVSGNSNVLTPAEVLVWGVHVQRKRRIH